MAGTCSPRASATTTGERRGRKDYDEEPMEVQPGAIPFRMLTGERGKRQESIFVAPKMKIAVKNPKKAYRDAKRAVARAAKKPRRRSSTRLSANPPRPRAKNPKAGAAAVGGRSTATRRCKR